MASESHPDRKQLAARARLLEAAAKAVADHLERCPDCQARVTSLEKRGDTGHSVLRRVPRYAWIAGCCAAAVIVLGAVICVTTGKGTVKIELSDPNAKVEVTIDGQQIDLAGARNGLRLSVGEHALKVTTAEFETCTHSFTVRRGTHETLKVTLVPKTLPGDRCP